LKYLELVLVAYLGLVVRHIVAEFIMEYCMVICSVEAMAFGFVVLLRVLVVVVVSRIAVVDRMVI
jgi:hypothetical protein